MNHARPNRYRFSALPADRVRWGVLPYHLLTISPASLHSEALGARAASWAEAFQSERPSFVLHRADVSEVPHWACFTDRSLASSMHPLEK